MDQGDLFPERLKQLENLKATLTCNPNYIDLVHGVWHTVTWYYGPSMWQDYSFPDAFIDEMTKYFYFPLNQFYYIFFIAVLITIIRYLFERVICEPLVHWLDLTSKNIHKFPESAWKTSFYSFAWSYNGYLLNYRYDYFHEPYSIWNDWSPGMMIPFDIQLMYLIQCGFYLHSIYATIYMDYKRKDYYAMLIHHALTLALMLVSYGTRFHKIGLLVLFVHDITDIWLELAKSLNYLSQRKSSRSRPAWEMATNGSFGMFVLCWFLFRLYWYPLKVLYSTGVVTAYRAYPRGCGLYGFFNLLLWLLLGLNIYWLYFILQLVFRLLIGNMKRLGDTREDIDDNNTNEDEDEDEDEKKSKSRTEAHSINNVIEKAKKKNK